MSHKLTLDEQPQFGIANPGVDYIHRPGVYALVVRDGHLLVVETASGHFLPGGGTDDGESPEDTLQRELLEETGFYAVGLKEFGTARQYVIDTSTGIGYNKIETIFHVAAIKQRTEQIERDHTARWVSLPEALAGLREPAQVWAVRRLPSPNR